jgi:lysophospholipase L1-like esterase
MKRMTYFLLCLLLLPACHGQEQGLQQPSTYQSSGIFKRGDRITALGNSITHQGYYLKNIMLYYMTRFPYMQLLFFNAGTSGDTSEDMNRRMERDILCNNSQVFIMMIGMNDAFRYVATTESDPARFDKTREAVEKYKAEVGRAVSNLKGQAREVILFTPSIFDNTATYSYGQQDSIINWRLGLFGEHIKTFSTDPKVKVVDMWTAMMAMNVRMQADNPSASIVSDWDRVHPYELGAFLMGYTFTKTLQEPGTVSVINIQNGKLAESYNVEVSQLSASPNQVSFEALERALPFPLIDAIAENVKKYMSDFFDIMNREIVQIKGLEDGNYRLLIDGEVVGNYTGKMFAEGVNLAENRLTPQYKQALQVSELLEVYRNKNEEVRLIRFVETTLFGLLTPEFNQWNNPQACIAQARYIKDNPALEHWGKQNLDLYIQMKPNEAALYAELNNLQSSAYRAAQTRTHKYEIKPLQ